MKDYHNHYVTGLTDVFENFRDMALREYKLDPAHSWTVPGFAWNCALKISKAELELITGPETFLFFENSIRGGPYRANFRKRRPKESRPESGSGRGVFRRLTVLTLPRLQCTIVIFLRDSVHCKTFL